MMRTPAPKTPRMNKEKACIKEPVKVYCRLRPTNNTKEASCATVISDSTVQISAPESAINFRDGCSKDTQYTFSYVFEQETSQKKVFEYVALPLVDGLLHAKSSLLFAYGITGSGKTYTMTGTPKDNGIIPKSLDVIFNSIANYQTRKFVIKPDKMNGFDIQSEQEARKECFAELHAQTDTKTPKVRRQESEWANRLCEETKIEDIDQDNMYAVFVTYVEIYNNSVFDLLDDNFEEMTARSRYPQSKLVREDATKSMYVHGVTEVEVKSAGEAYDIFNKGLRRRRVAHNSLNAESSRSHSVFTIRLVQAPLDVYGETILQDKKTMSISQLSFVDLAGSERSSRTNTTGQRLREAGNINNSLMTLRSCLEILRENEMNGSNKLVPYRDSKLTHLFKNFFDGESMVRVIVCVNPRSDDYDENTHVMKFAEMSQEVQVVKPTPLRNVDNLPSGRRRANQIFKQAIANLNDIAPNSENIPVDVGVPAVYSLASHFPDLCLTQPDDGSLIKILMQFLEVEITKRKNIEAEKTAKGKNLRDIFIDMEKHNLVIEHENDRLSADVEQQKQKVASSEVEIVSLKRQISGYERMIKRLQEEVQEKDSALQRKWEDQERDKKRFQSKMAQAAEKQNQQMEIKLVNQKKQMEVEIKRKDRKLQQLKKIFSDEYIATPSSSHSGLTSSIPTYDARAISTESLVVPSTVTSRRKVNSRTPAPVPQRPAVSNPRHRRSRSVGDGCWLEHLPQNAVPLNTIMQPSLKKRKSITKLTDIKDVANTKTSKYCLLTQEQDSDGDLETHIYKGDVVPTCGGGAQVILNDVEILKQKSPSSSPTRKRSGATSPDIGDRCRISIEGKKRKL